MPLARIARLSLTEPKSWTLDVGETLTLGMAPSPGTECITVSDCGREDYLILSHRTDGLHLRCYSRSVGLWLGELPSTAGHVRPSVDVHASLLGVHFDDLAASLPEGVAAGSARWVRTAKGVQRFERTDVVFSHIVGSDRHDVMLSRRTALVVPGNTPDVGLWIVPPGVEDAPTSPGERRRADETIPSMFGVSSSHDLCAALARRVPGSFSCIVDLDRGRFLVGEAPRCSWVIPLGAPGEAVVLHDDAAMVAWLRSLREPVHLVLARRASTTLPMAVSLHGGDFGRRALLVPLDVATSEGLVAQIDACAARCLAQTVRAPMPAPWFDDAVVERTPPVWSTVVTSVRERIARPRSPRDVDDRPLPVRYLDLLWEQVEPDDRSPPAPRAVEIAWHLARATGCDALSGLVSMYVVVGAMAQENPSWTALVALMLLDDCPELDARDGRTGMASLEDLERVTRWWGGAPLDAKASERFKRSPKDHMKLVRDRKRTFRPWRYVAMLVAMLAPSTERATGRDLELPDGTVVHLGASAVNTWVRMRESFSLDDADVLQSFLSTIRVGALRDAIACWAARPDPKGRWARRHAEVVDWLEGFDQIPKDVIALLR